MNLCLFFCPVQGVLTSLMQTTRDANSIESAIIEVTSQPCASFLFWFSITYLSFGSKRRDFQ